jgi:tripartite-type tricarboxylate transporter receptor subunit TctC
MKKVFLASACLMAFILPSSPATAQAWPGAKPLSIVVPFGPGASSDIETRLYAQKLSEALGQSVIMDYKPGAGGTLGSAYVARAASDGYTLLSTSGSFTAAAALYPKLPFDTLRDFAPLSLMSLRTTVLIVHPSRPYNNVREFMAYAKANPDRMTMGDPGMGSSPHLNAAWLFGMMGSKAVHVHYKATAMTMTEIIAGRIDGALGTALSALPHIKAGKMKALGVANAERSPLLPGLATIAEQGLPGFDYSSTFGLVTVAGVQQPVIDRLGVELGRIAKLPDVAKRLEADGGFMVGSTPAQFRQMIVTEVARYKKIVQDENIQVEE